MVDAQAYPPYGAARLKGRVDKPAVSEQQTPPHNPGKPAASARDKAWQEEHPANRYLVHIDRADRFFFMDTTNRLCQHVGNRQLADFAAVNRRLR